MEKDYITREEHKVWEYIKDKEIIDSELIKMIFPEITDSKKNKILHSLYKKGYLKRARKDLYFNPLKIADFYKLALTISDGYLGLNSALKYYRLIDYEDFTIFIMTKDFRKTIPLNETNYEVEYIPLRDLFTGFEKKEDMYVSSLEKTFFDCLLKPKYTGFSNITKAIYTSKIDWGKFMNYFKGVDNNSLFQRTGYILELIKKTTKMRIPSQVFEFLIKKVKSPVKLLPNDAPSIFNKKWKMEDNLGEKNILSWWY